MQFNAALLFVLSTSAAEYARPASSGVRTFVNGRVTDHGSKTDSFQIGNIEASPPVAKAGQPLDIHLKGKLTRVIDQGSKVVFNAQYPGGTLKDFEVDLCQLAKDRKFTHQCPAQPEDFDVHHILRIPAHAPKGEYIINAYGIDQDNEHIFNVTVHHLADGGAQEYQ